MKCSKCGESLPNEAVFCGNCGTKISRENKSVDEKIAAASSVVQSKKSVESKEVVKYLEDAIELIGKASSLVPKCSTIIEDNTEKEENERLRKKLQECETKIQALKASNEMLKNKVEALEAGRKNRCPKCGNKLTEEMRFCNVCGMKVNE